MDKMSVGEWKRLEAVERVEGGELTVKRAGELLGLAARQVRRIRRKVAGRGAAGVIHGNRGRRPWNRVSQSLREQIVKLRRGKYAGFNDQHFQEKLVEVEGLAVSRATVRRVLRAAGIEAARKRRPPRHRRRRERKAQEGQMIIWDGSPHRWLEQRGPQLCLQGAVDDATGKLLAGAHFEEQECAAGYLQVLAAIVRTHGVPWSAYMDRHSSLKRNDDYWSLEEEFKGEREPTQVGRALRVLGVEVIYALSPQAKGRVERLWGTLQDRLVSELRLAGARTVAEANAVLEQFREHFNRRFAVAASVARPAWRKPPRGLELERACGFYYAATVLNDNTVRIGGQVIDIPPGPRNRGYAHARVEVRQLLDGSWRVYYQDRLIATAPASELGELKPLKRRKPSAAYFAIADSGVAQQVGVEQTL
jgi:hypothetical protein